MNFSTTSVSWVLESTSCIFNISSSFNSFIFSAVLTLTPSDVLSLTTWSNNVSILPFVSLSKVSFAFAAVYSSPFAISFISVDKLFISSNKFTVFPFPSFILSISPTEIL